MTATQKLGPTTTATKTLPSGKTLTEVLDAEGRVVYTILEPSQAMKDLANALMSRENWKLATSVLRTTDERLAHTLHEALVFFLGGAEISVVGTGSDGSVNFEVWSKGYYHHIGA